MLVDVLIGALAHLSVQGLTFQDMVQQASGVVPTIDMVEIFSGVGSIAAAASAAGKSTATFDIEDCATQDALTRPGIERAIHLVASVRPKGLVWIAPECKTFCALCSKQTGRCAARPEGFEENPKVRDGNLMATLGVMLFALAFLRNCFPVLENPASNLFWNFPIVQIIYSHLPVMKVICDRCRFTTGFREKKPYGLLGTCSWMEDLQFS